MLIRFSNDDAWMIHDHCGIIGDIGRNDTTCPDFDIVADGDTTDNIGTCSDHDIVTDDRCSAFAFADRDPMIDRTVFTDPCIVGNHDAV